MKWPRTVEGLRADPRIASLIWDPYDHQWWCELANSLATDGGTGQGCFAERTIRDVLDFLLTVDVRKNP